MDPGCRDGSFRLPAKRVRLYVYWCCRFGEDRGNARAWALCRSRCLRRAKQVPAGLRSRYSGFPPETEDALLRITSLQERDIRNGLQEGGTIRGVFLVARPQVEGYEFMPYIRPSWNKRYLPLRLYEDRGDKSYRNAGRFLQLLRQDFGFKGSVLIHEARAPELARFKGLRPCDAPPGGASASDSPVPESPEEAEE